MAHTGDRISDHDRIDQLNAAVAALVSGVDALVAGLEEVVPELSRSARLSMETALGNYRDARLIAGVQIDTLMSQASAVAADED